MLTEVKGHLGKIKAVIAAKWNKLGERPWLQLMVWALVLTFIVEGFASRNVFGGFLLLFTHPFRWAINYIFVLLTVTPCLFFRRRALVRVILSSTWFGLAVANCVLLSFRTTPLAAIDFSLLGAVWSIIGNYLTPFQMVLVVLGFLLLIGALVVVGRRTKKVDRVVKTALILLAVLIVLTVLSLQWLCTSDKVMVDFSTLVDAYDDYGFVCCFVVSLVDVGIDKPDIYSDSVLDSIADEVKAIKDKVPEVKPNIIMLQIESFFDVSHLTEITFSENPTPVFSSLKENYSSGFLNVPSVGAGTANTEFEVITGMNIDFFGAGEYPYKTVLQDNSCESLCYDLKELGYSSHAIHNHNGTFYDRHIVFENLGFDTFTSLEYMDDVTFNLIDWADDRVLTNQIFKALESTEEQDFLYTISVQAHGKYPRAPLDGFEPTIFAEGIEDKSFDYAFEYYLSQIKKSDEFLGDLIAALEEFDEPVILVAYGDHLPNFEIDEEGIDNHNRFETEYVIWNNIGLGKQDKNLTTYQLGAEVLKRAGISCGLLPKLHQNFADRYNYLEMLELIEYDVFYGTNEVFDGENPYRTAPLQMGIDPIIIDRVSRRNGSLYVEGSGFTQWSTVCVEGKPRKTTFIDKEMLRVEVDDMGDISSGDEVTVAQIGEDKFWLSQTETLFYN
ncbi:MAG: LTA synthase family protein [Oscillospiraceae bacterium]|nr:LTA synthase family protein [Oscillospiraceae bacterium]